MTVYKRDHGIYHYDFELLGVRYQGSTRRRTKREAEAVEDAERKAILDRVQLGATVPISLQAAIEGWLAAIGSKLRDSRNNASRARLVTAKGGLPADTPLDRVGNELGRWVDRMVASGQADGTINRKLALVQSVVAWAASRGYAAPMLRLKGLRRPEVPKARFLSDEEVQQVLVQLEPNGDPLRQDQYDLAVLLLDSGARYSEIAELQWLDCFDVFGAARVRFTQTKSDKAREVALPLRAAKVLRRRWEARGAGAVYVFPSREDKNKPRGHAIHGIMAAIERAGCNATHMVERYGRATVHTFRHTHAALLLRRGVPIHHVSARLGHASIVMTQRVYGHIQAKDGDGAVLAALEG